MICKVKRKLYVARASALHPMKNFGFAPDRKQKCE